MCFHVATPPMAELASVLPKGIIIENYTPHFHLSGFNYPCLPVMIIEEPKIVRPTQWGLIPEWVNNANDANISRNVTLNSMAETIFTAPVFRNFAVNRCLIFVNGFFEWKSEGKDKVPYFIYMAANKPFALAGIYHKCIHPKTKLTYTGFSIINCEANELMAEINNTKKRMPLILEEEKWEVWMDVQSSRPVLQTLIKALPDDILQAHQISNLITGNVKNKDVQEVQHRVKSQAQLF